MKKIVSEFFEKPISKDQCKDTGMAMVLLLLIASSMLKRGNLITVAVVVLVIDMTFPRLFRPLASLWFGFSHLLGTVMSKILLTIVFLAVVTPVGLLRRLMGKDSLQLKSFKGSRESVMLIRNHTFVGQDLERPY